MLVRRCIHHSPPSHIVNTFKLNACRRVLNISHTSTFDGRVVERLFADLDSQMSLVATAIKTSTDDRSLGELSAFKIILRDAENQVRSFVTTYALMLENYDIISVAEREGVDPD